MDIPAACPVCGAYSLTQDQHASVMLAVCDVLVFKVLETVGKVIVRSDRHRFRMKGTRPWFEMHTLWPPEEQHVTKALRGAWDVVPAMLASYGCCEVTPAQVTAMLDSYVHDLCITGTPHSIDQLRYRFLSLGLPVYLHEDALT